MWQKLDVLREKKLFCNGKKFEKVLSASENCSMVILGIAWKAAFGLKVSLF